MGNEVNAKRLMEQPPRVSTSSFSEQSDAELVRRARRNESHAFDLLMERHQVMAYYIALRMISQEETARELVQEAMLQAYLSLDHLRDETHFKSWFYGIMLNVCRSWLRSRSARDISSLDSAATMLQFERLHPSPDPHEQIEQRELAAILLDAFAALSPKNRTVALLFYYNDLSVQEIAEREGISPTAVKNRLLKTRIQLRQHLTTHHPDLVTTMVSATTRKTRENTMLRVTVARSIQDQVRTLILLLDEQQRVLPLWISQVEQGHMGGIRLSHRDEPLTAEPLTLDFLANILTATGSTLAEISIDRLQPELLYAQVQIQTQGQVRTVKARINDALPLALRLQSPITVNAAVMDEMGQKLSELPGTTPEQQIEALIDTIRKMPNRGLNSPYALTARAPRNLTFEEGLRGWSFIGFPRESTSYTLDTVVRRHGKASLAISVAASEQQQSMGSVTHEGFQADSYRGKRLRMIAYIKTDDAKQATLILQVHGPDRMVYLGQARTKIIRGTSDWTPHELVMDVPPDATLIQCNLGLMGPGKAWLDEVQFAIVDPSVPLSEAGLPHFPLPEQPQNTFFEHGMAHWDLWGSHPQDYERGLDYSSDTSSAYLKPAILQPRGYAMLRQMIRIQPYMGKRVQLSAMLKTRDVTRKATLYLEIDSSASNAMLEQAVSGTTDWERYTVELDIPEMRHGLLRFGIALYGAGQVWLQDVRLEIIGNVS